MATSSIDEVPQGYDKERFAGHVDDEFICAICLGVLRKPIQLPCEHMFCEICIKRWCSSNSQCPNCRGPVNGLLNCHPPSRALISLLNKIPIRCVNVEHGCQALFNLTNIEQHEAKCEHKLVACPLSGCAEKVPKSALPRHITACTHRSQVCQTCELALKDGNAHSKDDCIIALKRALSSCVDVIVQRQITQTLSNQTVSTLPQMPQIRLPSQWYRADYYRAEIGQLPGQNGNHDESSLPIDLATTEQLQDSDDSNSSVQSEPDGSVVSWSDVLPAYANVEIDLTSNNGAEPNPSMLTMHAGSDESVEEDDERNQNSIRHVSDNESNESIVGTNASWHSLAQVVNDDRRADQSYADHISIAASFDQENAREHSSPNSSIPSPSSPLYLEDEDDGSADGDNDESTDLSESNLNIHRSRHEDCSSDDEQIAQPKRFRQSFEGTSHYQNYGNNVDERRNGSLDSFQNFYNHR